jgi:hypothetical protein
MTESFWTPERAERVVELAGMALLTREIGRRLGCTRNAVIGRLNRAGIRMRPPKTSETTIYDRLPDISLKGLPLDHRRRALGQVVVLRRSRQRARRELVRQAPQASLRQAEDRTAMRRGSYSVPWWHFWDPDSGLPGGIVVGLLFSLLVGILALLFWVR